MQRLQRVVEHQAHSSWSSTGPVTLGQLGVEHQAAQLMVEHRAGRSWSSTGGRTGDALDEDADFSAISIHTVSHTYRFDYYNFRCNKRYH